MVANKVAEVYLEKKMTPDTERNAPSSPWTRKSWNRMLASIPSRRLAKTAHIVMEGGRLYDTGPTTMRKLK